MISLKRARETLKRTSMHSSRPLNWNFKRNLREKERSSSKNLTKNLNVNVKKSFASTSLRCHA